MPKMEITVDPRDQGRPMSLADFESAEGQPGCTYELGRGVVIVVHVPDRQHLVQVDEIRHQLSVYRQDHPGQIYAVAGSGECKVLLADQESERHPDVVVYKDPLPEGPDVWAAWVPEIIVEVVSPGSEERDYQDKREEYLAFGAGEYWIVNAERQEVLVLRRWGGRWKEQVVRPPEAYRTRLLPGFEFHCARVFQAAQVV
jgi:Uma2 family endonuclease